MYALIYIPRRRWTHDCETEFWGGGATGTIARCTKCGRNWYFSDESDGCAPPRYFWKPVRWWDFRRRYLVALHQPAKAS